MKYSLLFQTWLFHLHKTKGISQRRFHFYVWVNNASTNGWLIRFSCTWCNEYTNIILNTCSLSVHLLENISTRWVNSRFWYHHRQLWLIIVAAFTWLHWQFYVHFKITVLSPCFRIFFLSFYCELRMTFMQCC